MRTIIVHDEINTAYGNRKNELSNVIFQRNFELLILNCFFVKKETLRFTIELCN